MEMTWEGVRYKLRDTEGSPGLPGYKVEGNRHNPTMLGLS